jgi:hypothetical protein
MSEYPVQDWWTRRQRELVEDRSKSWVEQAFSPSHAVLFESSGGEVMRKATPGDSAIGEIEKGWEHEHCALCWAKISARAGENQRGYTDGTEWLCPECYAGYVLPREENASRNDAD